MTDEGRDREKSPDEAYTELVLVVHASNLAEAEVFKTELEANGIPAILEQESASVGGVPDLAAGVPVLVPEDFADRAAELIAELESSQSEDEDVEDRENIFEDDALEDLDNDLEEDDIEEEDLDDEFDDEDLDDEFDDEDDDWDDEEDWDDDEDWDDEEED